MAQGNIEITGIPYAPGTACGTLHSGPHNTGPERIAVLRHDEIGGLAAPAAGLVIVEGAPLSHTMIGLLGLAVPTVIVSEAQAARLQAGVRVSLNGFSGAISSAPDAPAFSAQTPALQAGLPVNSSDGVAVRLRASVRNEAAARKALEAGAEAIGLARSEFFVPQTGAVPTPGYFRDAFSGLCQAARPLAVTIRLLDLAGDKLPDWLPASSGAGGTLGLQGVRLFGTEPARTVYRAQLAAIAAIAGEFDVGLLIPYLVRFEELGYWMDDVRARLPPAVPVGAMVETPLGALDIGDWCGVADFVSIGCNDLMQCLFAADRDRPELAPYLDPCAPPLFRWFRQVAEGAADSLERVQLCGVWPQMQGVLPILLGLGYRSFSVDPVYIPHLAQCVRETSIAEAAMLAREVCAARTSREVAEISGLHICRPLPFVAP